MASYREDLGRKHYKILKDVFKEPPDFLLWRDVKILLEKLDDLLKAQGKTPGCISLKDTLAKVTIKLDSGNTGEICLECINTDIGGIIDESCVSIIKEVLESAHIEPDPIMPLIERIKQKWSFKKSTYQKQAKK